MTDYGYACCIAGGPASLSNGKVSCSSEYQKQNWNSSHGCDANLAYYCKQGQNLFSPTCTAWLSSYGKNSDRIFDPIITEVCLRPENAVKGECACIIAANDLQKKLGAPPGFPVQCISNACLGSPSAFRTVDQLQPCPPIINCSITVDGANFVANNPGKFDVNFVQNCGNTGGNTGGNTSGSSKTTKIIEWGAGIIGGIFFLILFIVAIYLIWSHFSSSGENNSDSGAD